MHRTHTIALALATTAAVGAFAVLPAASALASGEPEATTTSPSTTAPDETTADPGTTDPSTTDPGADDTADDSTGGTEAEDEGDDADAPSVEVKVRAVDDDSVRVTWRVENAAAAPTGFSIDLLTGPKDLATVVQTATESADAVQHDFVSLDPDTRYSARVTATEPDGTTLVSEVHGGRTDRTDERKAADHAADVAKQARHDAEKAAKAAEKAAKKADHAAVKAQQRSDRAAKKAAKQALAIARKAARTAERLQQEAAKATRHAVRADRRADDADHAATESEIEND